MPEKHSRLDVQRVPSWAGSAHFGHCRPLWSWFKVLAKAYHTVQVARLKNAGTEMNKVSIIAPLAAGIALASCETKPEEKPNVTSQVTLDEYVSGLKYTPFELPRADWGMGTIITFEDGAEKIQAFNSDCLNLEKNDAGYKPSPVSIPETTYGIANLTKFGARLAEGAIDGLNIGGAFENKNIDTVAISFTQSNEETISRIRMQSVIESLVAKANDDTQEQSIRENARNCIGLMNSSTNFVIDRVLAVDGLSVKFKDKNRRAIALDADILGKVGLGGAAGNALVGQTNIKAKDGTRRLLGYRTYKVTFKGGFVDSEVILDPVSQSEIMTLKEASDTSD